MDPGFKSLAVVLSAGIVVFLLLCISATENTKPPLWDCRPEIFIGSSFRLSPSLSSGPDSGNCQPHTGKKCMDRTDNSQGNSKHGSQKLHLK